MLNRDRALDAHLRSAGRRLFLSAHSVRGSDDLNATALPCAADVQGYKVRLYCTVLYCTVLPCAADVQGYKVRLYWTVLYCTVLPCAADVQGYKVRCSRRS